MVPLQLDNVVALVSLHLQRESQYFDCLVGLRVLREVRNPAEVVIGFAVDVVFIDDVGVAHG